MKKVIILLFAIVGFCPSVNALVCVEGDCNKMGYTTNKDATIPDCEAYIYCPYNTDLKTCARYNAYPLTECPEGGVCAQSPKYSMLGCASSMQSTADGTCECIYTDDAECADATGLSCEEDDYGCYWPPLSCGEGYSTSVKETDCQPWQTFTTDGYLDGVACGKCECTWPDSNDCADNEENPNGCFVVDTANECYWPSCEEGYSQYIDNLSDIELDKSECEANADYYFEYSTYNKYCYRCFTCDVSGYYPASSLDCEWGYIQHPTETDCYKCREYVEEDDSDPYADCQTELRCIGGYSEVNGTCLEKAEFVICPK